MAQESDEMIVVGRIAGLYGVRGWVKVYSHTEPRDNILNYTPWHLRLNGRWIARALVDGRSHGKGIVALLEGVADRDQAAQWLQCDIAVRRDQLPELDNGEYYWSELIGLKVVTVDGMELGHVDSLLETGANDVLVVKGERERLIPYLPEQVVKQVDRRDRVITVDWDPDF